MELIMSCRLQKLWLIIYSIETMHALHLLPFYFILDTLQKYLQRKFHQLMEKEHGQVNDIMG